MNKLHAAAITNTQLIEDEEQHYWIFEYGLNNKDLSKSLHALKSVLKGALQTHSCEKSFDIHFQEMEGALGCADRKTIFLNVGLFTKVSQEHLVSVLSAVALHEYFHILHTNWNSPYLKLNSDSPYWHIWQFVEDTRIEVIGKSTNFSCWESFSLLIRNVLCESMKSFNLEEDEAKLNSAVKLIFKWVRMPHLITDEDGQFEVLDGVKLLEELEKIVPDYGPLDPEFSTDAVVDAIKNLLDKLQDQTYEPQKSPQGTEQPQSEGVGGNSEGDKSPEKEIDDNENEGDTEEDSNEEPPKLDQKQFSKTMQDFKKSMNSPTGAKEKKVSQLIILLDINPVGLDNSIQHKGTLYISPNELLGGAEAPSYINCKPVQVPAHQGYLSVFIEDYNSVRAGIRALRNKFLIRHSETRNEVKEQRTGYLDRTRLHKSSFDDRIFKTYDTVKSVGMDISLLLDMSGSMQISSRIKQCRRAGILLAKACEGIPGLNLCIYGHTTGSDTQSCAGTCEITNLYGDLAKKDIKAIGTMQPTGGTYDGFAIDFVGRRVLRNGTNNEKWLIYVADGEPCAHDYSGSAAIEHTGKVVRRLSKKGLHIIGVDIGDMPHFKQMFPMSVQFLDVRSLVSNLGRLVGTLVKTRSREIHV